MTLITRIILSLSLSFFFSGLSFCEPNNLAQLRREIIEYYDSGLYAKELNKQIDSAHRYIIHQALINKKNNSPKKLAIVLDIDETSLSNYQHMVKRDFVGQSAQIHKEILQADAQVIKPMLSLFNDSQKHGIKVFFITGRNESERDATRLNLSRAGYKNWAGLYLRPLNYQYHSIIPFKSKARELIASKGYTIIASIGDQYSDLKGGYTQKGFKLPNPFYYLP